jgi:hypothetical protein
MVFVLLMILKLHSHQVIPVTYNGSPGNFVLSMFLDDHPPIAAGRELWGFPKKLASPKLQVDEGADLEHMIIHMLMIIMDNNNGKNTIILFQRWWLFVVIPYHNCN